MPVRPAILLLAVLATGLAAAEESVAIPCGPLGGSLRLTEGVGILRIATLDGDGLGRRAGLRPDDVLIGVGGRRFTATGDSGQGYLGAVEELGLAIDAAESGDGHLALTVLRPGIGTMAVTVDLPPTGGLGPAFPRSSRTYDRVYEAACTRIAAATGSNGVNYMTGWCGLVLLGHPRWDALWRAQLENLRDRCRAYLDGIILVPVESDQPGYVDAGLENWQISTATMYLAAWRMKTGDTTVDATVQRAVEALCHRVQTRAGNLSANSTAQDGMMGHGGVSGDYGHIPYPGINIVNAHAISALAWGQRAGAATIDGKFAMCWNWLGRCTASDGNVGYMSKQGGGDSAGRTAGSLFGFLLSSAGAPTGADADRCTLMADYLARQNQRLQHAHAYTMGGRGFYQLTLPWLSHRQQDFVRWHWRFHDALARQADDSLVYFGGRENNGGDGYVGTTLVEQVTTALPGSCPGLPGIPAAAANRLHADIRTPHATWPGIEARACRITSAAQALAITITDAAGAVLGPADLTTAWTQESGPATAAFTDVANPSTTVTFPTGGLYRLVLTVTRNGHTLREPIDATVILAPRPADLALGAVDYQVYHAGGAGITGSTVASLTGHATFPALPDNVTTLARIEGTATGNDFGARISGFIIPPTTGDYRFHIASDDASELRLNPIGRDPAGAQPIASVTGWTSRYQWDKYPAQTSAVIPLQEGVPCWFEVLHKEGTGGEHVAVAWTGPGMATPTVIGGDAIARLDTTPAVLAITTQPADAAVAMGASVTFTTAATGPGPLLFTWRRDGVPCAATSTDGVLTIANCGAGSAGGYDCVVTSPAGTLTSRTAALTITDAGGAIAGALWQEVYTGIGGSGTTDLVRNDTYPRGSSASSQLTVSEGVPASVTSDHGQRWSGWLTPDTTGDHRFFVAADDTAELWLSSDDTPASKRLLVRVASYTAARDWDRNASAPVALMAGSRYYVEFLHKQSGGGQHAGFTWQKPGAAAPVDGDAPIAAAFLSCVTGGSGLTSAPPVAMDDTYAVEADAPRAVTAAAGVLANDRLATGATVTLLAAPANGTLALAADGSFTFTPSAGWTGTATATYRVDRTGTMGAGGLNPPWTTGTVTFAVARTNRAPMATDHAINAYVQSPRSFTLTGSDADGDTLGFRIITPPAHGSARITGATCTYTGAPGFRGVDTCTFTVDDGRLFDTTPATVTITVSNPPAPPAAATGLTATLVDGPRVQLSWTDASDDESGFRIERQAGDGAFTIFATVAGGVTTTADGTVAAGGTYRYRIVAFNDMGDTSPSATATVSIPAPPGEEDDGGRRCGSGLGLTGLLLALAFLALRRLR